MASRPFSRSFLKALPLLVAPAIAAACGLSFDELPTTTPVDAGVRDTGADTSVDAAPDQSAPPDSGPDATDGGGIVDSGADVLDPDGGVAPDSGPACNDAQPAANEITVATSAAFPFKASYTPVFLGALPGGKKLGACAVEGDTLVVAYDVGTTTASLQRVPLVRTCDGSHVSSIGLATKIVDAPGIDLGFLSNPFAYVPTRPLSATAFPYFECANGAAACTKTFDFTTGDAAATSLSFALLPNINGVATVRAYATPSANMYSVDNASKTVTKLETLTAFPVTQPVAVSANSPVFGNRYAISPVESQNKISFLQIDNDGGLVKPSVGQNTGFASTTIPLRGACQDPATGDVIFTAFDGSGRIDSIKGFAKP